MPLISVFTFPIRHTIISQILNPERHRVYLFKKINMLHSVTLGWPLIYVFSLTFVGGHYRIGGLFGLGLVIIHNISFGNGILSPVKYLRTLRSTGYRIQTHAMGLGTPDTPIQCLKLLIVLTN